MRVPTDPSDVSCRCPTTPSPLWSLTGLQSASPSITQFHRLFPLPRTIGVALTGFGSITPPLSLLPPYTSSSLSVRLHPSPLLRNLLPPTYRVRSPPPSPAAAFARPPKPRSPGWNSWHCRGRDTWTFTRPPRHGPRRRSSPGTIDFVRRRYRFTGSPSRRTPENFIISIVAARSLCLVADAIGASPGNGLSKTSIGVSARPRARPGRGPRRRRGTRRGSGGGGGRRRARGRGP